MNERELIDLKERIVIATSPLELPYDRVPFTPEEREFLLDAVNEKAAADTVPELVSPDGHLPGRINETNTKAIATDVLRAIRRHYYKHAISRERVFEILNALAFVVGAVLGAINNDEKAVEFFEQARKLNHGTGE